MHCKDCNTLLNPLTLKQATVGVHGELRFELECYSCGFKNSVSKKMYFKIKTDFNGMKPIEPINNKLPSEMNVMFCSLQRCGISWVIRVLNDFHEPMFGKSIPYTKENAEISKLLATRTRFPLPELWNCVYEADPNMLVERGYDRIVIVERDLEELLKVHQVYFHEDLTWQQRETMIRKIKQSWELVYNSGINNPRVIQVKLEDLNNYTKDTFNKLMDFLNFPKVGRPPIIPIPLPNRNWEAYSSLLIKDGEICNKLKGIETLYRENQYKKEIPKLEKMLIIGPIQNKNCHFSENIYNIAKDKINVKYISPDELAPINSRDLKLYDKRKTLYPLSKVLKKIDFEPDLVMIDECRFSWLNDINIPVFYQHREFKRPPTVFYPDVALFWHKGLIDYYQNIFASHWSSRLRELRVMHIAVNPGMYKPEEKTIEGIVGIGSREALNDVIGYMKELTNIATLQLQLQEQIKFKEMGFQWFDDPITDVKYRDILPKCKILWVQLANRQYTTRRMLDAMACKTLCIMKIENDEHEQVLYNMGYKQGVHYIKITTMEDMLKTKSWLDGNEKIVDAMIEKAYEATITRNTYSNRFDFIKDLYSRYTEKREGDVYDYA